MNTTSVSRVEAVPSSPGGQVLVWDAPVRVFHWLMVLCFAGAWLTAESERWQLVHVTLGYTMAGLVVFRLLWGLVGTRPARFSSFLRPPAAAARYLRAALRGRPEHHTGHNPAGAWAIAALLLLAAAVTATGWAGYSSVGGLEEVHEAAASLMLALVGVHLTGVLVGSWLHRENLVRAMVTGRKRGAPQEAARRTWRSIAALILAAVLGFWAMQWQAAPMAGSGQAPPEPAGARHDDHDDD